MDLEQLRERIGFVTQDTQLFSGTIRENLLFVRPDATDAECLEVLHKAACDSLLARADKGLDTVIGEGGVKVSGGEKQRLSIARALLRRPHLLVFDEATSSLDSLTEEEISRTIRDVAAARDVITILIAHRLSTVMHADRIHVLERGRIVETGAPRGAAGRRRGCTTRCGGSRWASGGPRRRRRPYPSSRPPASASSRRSAESPPATPRSVIGVHPALRPALAGRRPLLALEERGAPLHEVAGQLATTATIASGSNGFSMWTWKPAACQRRAAGVAWRRRRTAWRRGCGPRARGTASAACASG